MLRNGRRAHARGPAARPLRGRGCRGQMGAAQIGSVVHGHTAGQLYGTLILTVEGSIARLRQNVKTRARCVAFREYVTKFTVEAAFDGLSAGYFCSFATAVGPGRTYLPPELGPAVPSVTPVPPSPRISSNLASRPTRTSIRTPVRGTPGLEPVGSGLAPDSLALAPDSLGLAPDSLSRQSHRPRRYQADLASKRSPGT